ncbi:NADH-quinone oxidoreductase subunit NuoE [Lichenicoccus roseus]|uniref:NADH-quinone oxidoreductase subunit NuoE n=1 Tax=Lichenicoccus roseus TaxID=2683649 RepID=A0A5R9JBU9_9PROT|nr:NADH-quinone oxidoreductase subunit NuoE [Lichenicoccus roseus]TLU71758.1 NADH-quinone oxidoreductase subunit NuoE [Lichenicoccus roseus]
MSTAETLADSASETLPDALREEIRLLGQHEAHPRAACIEALQRVQREFRWVSDAHLREVAGLLGMSAADLDGVATYFNLIFRRPVGRRVLLLCDSVSCWLMGRERLEAHLSARLGIRPGQTTPDGDVTLLPTVCLGHCDHAPALMLGDALHGDVDTQKLDAILEAAG